MNVPNYDWIQWYTIIVFIFSIIGIMFDTKEYINPYRYRVINLIFCIPYVGRVLAWW